MKTYKSTLLAVASMMFAACGADEAFQSEYNDSNAIRINAQINTVSGGFQTKSNPMGDANAQTKFNANDVISVAAGNQAAVKYTFDGSNWTAEADKNLYWMSETMTFTAFYPGDVDGASATAFTTPTTYADAAAVAKADYMVFSGDKNESDGKAVTLGMSRKMARIIISKVNFNGNKYDGYTVRSIQIHGNTKGYKHGAAEAGDIAVTAFKHTDDKYYALLSPTTQADESDFVTVTLTKQGASDVTVTAQGIPATEAAMSYTYELTIDGSAQLKVTTIEIGDWTENTFATGKSTEITNPTGFSLKSELTNLAYGEKVNLKDIVTLTPTSASFDQIVWSDESGLVSVDKNGVLSVKYSNDPTKVSMIDQTLTLKGTVNGAEIGTANVKLAGGHFIHNFADGMDALDGFELNKTNDNQYTTVMTQQGDSVYFDLQNTRRQDIKLASTNNAGKYYISTTKYKYFAVKIRRPFYYDVTNGYNGVAPGTENGWNKNKMALNLTPMTGDNPGHQNFYKELDMSALSLQNVTWDGKAKVYVFDLSGVNQLNSVADTSTGLVDMKYFSLVVADVLDTNTAKNYAIYWLGTFGSLDEIKAYYEAHE